MPDTKPAKTCVHCGEDCSAQPRIKDSHDNYYHKICHEAVAAENKSKILANVPPPEPSDIPDPAKFEDQDPIPMMMDDTAAEIDDSAAPPETDKPFSDRPSLLDDDDDDDLILDDSDGVGLQLDDSQGD